VGLRPRPRGLGAGASLQLKPQSVRRTRRRCRQSDSSQSSLRLVHWRGVLKRPRPTRDATVLAQVPAARACVRRRRRVSTSRTTLVGRVLIRLLTGTTTSKCVSVYVESWNQSAAARRSLPGCSARVRQSTTATISRSARPSATRTDSASPCSPARQRVPEPVLATTSAATVTPFSASVTRRRAACRLRRPDCSAVRILRSWSLASWTDGRAAPN
jgi:hypothetical protein